MVAVSFLIVRTDALGKLPLDLSPDVLAQKAHDVVAQLGYDPKAVDKAIDFDYDEDFQRWAEEHDQPHSDWNKILAEQPPILRFTYRQSPRYMMPLDFQRSMTPGVMTFTDPPTTLSGMINLMLDTNGRLVYFQALPAEGRRYSSAGEAYGLESSIRGLRSRSITVSVDRSSVDIARQFRYARGLDRQMAGQQPAPPY